MKVSVKVVNEMLDSLRGFCFDRKIKVVQHFDDEFTFEIPQCEYDEMLEQVRKETAREIIKEFSLIQWGQSELDNVCIRLSEQYGVEVNN